MNRWIQMFSRAWLAERRWDDNELEWLEAGMMEVAEKVMDMRGMNKKGGGHAVSQSTWFGFWIGVVVASIVWLVILL